MKIGRDLLASRALLALLICLPVRSAIAQSNDAGLIQRIDAAVHKRYENVLSFTDVEHYSVFRGRDESHPAAQMTVKVTYRKGIGKSYAILSQSGSQVVQRFGLRPLLENEKKINDPAAVEQSFFTSANYRMHVKPEETRMLDGRRCFAVEITALRKAPNMIDGTLWVDGRDGFVVRVEGIASKRPSVFAGTTKMMREYAKIDGYGMATYARAESTSALFGRTVVTIDYSDYHIQAQAAR